MQILWKLRILIFYFFIALLCVVITPFCWLFKRVISKDTMYNICKYFSVAYILLAKYICSLNYDVQGLEKLPNIPCVVLCNHQSFWENIFVQMLIPKHSWVIKKEIYDIPLFGPAFIKCADPITVDRSDPSSMHKVIKKGMEKLKDKLWIVMFPEGTRVPINRNIKLKPSGVKLAMLADVPIVIVVHNSGLFWPPKNFWIKTPGTITVKIVDTIMPAKYKGNDPRQINSMVEKIMHTEKAKLI